MARWRLEAAALSHRGLLRPDNEDNFYLNGRWLSLAAMPHGGRMLADSGAPFQLYAVCDGLGGEAAGELASHEAAQALGSLQATHLNGLPDAELMVALRTLTDGVALLNPTGEQRTGTTLAGLLWQAGGVRVINIGDSRVYRLRGGELAQLSRDHSEVQQMVDLGLMTPFEARLSPRRYLITQYLGLDARDAAFRPYLTQPQPARGGDVYLLCSDGLTDMAEDEAIRRVLLRAHAPGEAVDALVALALDNGGHDNVTALCVFVRGPKRGGLWARRQRRRQYADG